jgi:hypothetical protein
MLTFVSGQLVLFAGTLLAAPVEPPAQTAAKLNAVLEAKWKEAKLTPVAAVDDATFLRRVSLDLTGQVPSVEKVQAFLADNKPDKRSRLVDELLASDAFAEHWAKTWAIRLTDRRPYPQDSHNGQVLQEYLRNSIKENKPYTRIVREIVTGDGLADASGPANFYLRYGPDPVQLVGAVSKQFMGTSLQCAQCHDHVFAEWKQSDFWGLAAVFGRVKRVNTDDGGLAGLLEARRGELERPDPKGKPDENGNVPMLTVAPKLPGADAPIKGKRRNALADWLTADDNPYLARHFVNQTWTQLFGEKLIAGLDDLDGIEESKHGELLELLAADFKAGGHDLKRLVRVLVLSRAYQLGSQGGQGNEDDVKRAHLQLEHFARFRSRPLSVDQLYASILRATAYNPMPPAEPDPAAKPPEPVEDPEEDPADHPVDSLGANPLTVQRALVLLNSDFVHQAVNAGAENVVKKKGAKISDVHIEYLFLATLGRKPVAEEKNAMRKLLKGEDKNAGLADVVWALLNSAEFNSNH